MGKEKNESMKKNIRHEANNRSFRRIWFSSWWPVLLGVVLFLAVSTLLVYQIQEMMEEETFQLVVNGQLDELNQIQSNYDRDVQNDSEAAYAQAMAALERQVNTNIFSQNMAGVYLCDDQGAVVLEQEPSLYLRHVEGDSQYYYRCADRELERQILERYEAWMEQATSLIRIDEAYIQGSECYPLRVNIYTEVEEKIGEETELRYQLREEIIAEANLSEDGIYLTGLDLLKEEGYNEDTLSKIAEAKENGTYYPTSVYLAEDRQVLPEDVKNALLTNMLEEGIFDAELQYANVATTYELQRENHKTYREIVIPIVLENKQYYFVLWEQKQAFSRTDIYVILGWGIGILFSAFIALVIAKGFARTMRKEQELICRQRDYTNALAHDLKTPLMAISGYTENLQSNTNPEKQNHYYDAIYSNIDYMNRLIMDMLSLARLQRPREVLCREQVDLRKMAEVVTGSFEQEMSEKNLHLEIEGKGYMEGDPQLLERAYRNLVENAVKYSPAGEAVRIQLADDFIQITNTGVTLPKEKWNAVFQPFVKGDEARERETGIGLGLAIVKDIAELHGFQCSLECTGQTTTVTLKSDSM